MVVIVSVEEAYGHCAKAILRGKLWESDFKLSSADVPTLAELMTYHLKIKDEEFDRIDGTIQQDLKDSMY